MRSATRRSAGAVVIVVLGTLAAGAQPAAGSRSCGRVEVGGDTSVVYVDRGKVTCRRARRIVRTAIEDTSWPAGWRCVFGHSGDAFELQCLSSVKIHPRILIRVVKPVD